MDNEGEVSEEIESEEASYGLEEEDKEMPDYGTHNFKENIRSDTRLISIFNLIDDG